MLLSQHAGFLCSGVTLSWHTTRGVRRSGAVSILRANCAGKTCPGTPHGPSYTLEPAQGAVAASLLETELKSWGLSRWWPKPMVSWESPGSLRCQTSMGRDLQEQERLGRHPGTPGGLTPVVALLKRLLGSWFCFLRVLPRVWHLCCLASWYPIALCVKGLSPSAVPCLLRPLEPSLRAPSLPLGSSVLGLVCVGDKCV